MNPSPEEKDPQPEDYLRLLATHERSLSNYVHSLVLNAADAEDIVQECKVVLWNKFDQFKPGSNFLAWARKIALHQILNFRRTSQRRPLYPLDPDFIESVAAEIDRSAAHLERRSAALKTCLKKLPAPQRQLILWRYYEGDGIDGIARKAKRTEGAVYRALSRIRSALNDCISKTLNTTGS